MQPGVDSSSAAPVAASAALKLRGYQDKLRELVPKSLLEWIPALQPTPSKAEQLLRAAYPGLQKASEKWQKLVEALSPYCSDDGMEAAKSLALLFCGGQLALTLACWEAFQVAGSRHVSRSWQELRESFQEAKSALEKDQDVAVVFGGAAAAKMKPGEMLLEGLKEVAAARTDEEKAVARRKVLVVVRCVDPSKFFDATLGFWTGALAVFATLRQRFVYCVNVGAQVGQRVAHTLMPVAQPRLHELFPEYKHWVDFSLRAAASSSGVLTSWLLVEVIGAFNGAFQGAARLVALIDKRRREGKLKWMGEWTATDEQIQAAVWACALVGFSTQVKTRRVPGMAVAGQLIKIPLAPFFLVEYLLRMVSLV